MDGWQRYPVSNVDSWLCSGIYGRAALPDESTTRDVQQFGCLVSLRLALCFLLRSENLVAIFVQCMARSGWFTFLIVFASYCSACVTRCCVIVYGLREVFECKVTVLLQAAVEFPCSRRRKVTNSHGTTVLGSSKVERVAEVVCCVREKYRFRYQLSEGDILCPLRRRFCVNIFHWDN